MQRRLRSISAKTVSVALNYLTYFSIILASTMGPLYSAILLPIGSDRGQLPPLTADFSTSILCGTRPNQMPTPLSTFKDTGKLEIDQFMIRP